MGFISLRWLVSGTFLPPCAARYPNHGRPRVTLRKRSYNLETSSIRGSVSKGLPDREENISPPWPSQVKQEGGAGWVGGLWMLDLLRCFCLSPFPVAVIESHRLGHP